MQASNLEKYKKNFINSLISGIVTGTFMYWLYVFHYLVFITGFLIGFFIYAGIFTYKELFEKKYLRKLPILLILIINTIIHGLIIIFIVILFVGAIFLKGNFLLYFEQPGILKSSGYIVGLIFGFLLSLVFNFYLMVTNLLGTNVLLKLFIGKYRKPREEYRIFLILDLASSTAIAEKTGHMVFISLLNDVFFEIGEAVSRTLGEIYKYVGDEVIISWPLKKGLHHSNCMRCMKLIDTQLKKRSKYFFNKYNLVPELKSGMHAGLVVTGEIGFIKKEIGYAGDTLNTTARIAVECKNHPYQLLISEELYKQLNSESEMIFVDMGFLKFKGKENEMKIYGWNPC